MGKNRTDDIQGSVLGRRIFLTSGVTAAAAAITAAGLAADTARAEEDKYATPADSKLPPSDMKLDLARTALVVTDPQIDFLSPEGVTWGVVGASVKELNTVENLDRLFAAAKKAGLTVAISPHYYYPTAREADAQDQDV
jgi:hypothetical protein